MHFGLFRVKEETRNFLNKKYEILIDFSRIQRNNLLHLASIDRDIF